MSLTISNYNDEGSGSDFKDVEPGTHAAIITGVLDCGFQKPYQDDPESFCTHQCVIVYEVDEKTDDGKYRLTISEPYNVTLRSDKAKLRKPVHAAFPKLTDEQKQRFDLTTLVGKGVMITVEEKASGKVKVAGVSPLPKGMSAEWEYEAVTEPFGLAKYLEGKAISAEDAKAWNDKARTLRDNAKDDDIPF